MMHNSAYWHNYANNYSEFDAIYDNITVSALVRA